MLDAKFVEENPEFVINKTASRGMDLDLREFLKLAKEKKTFLQQIESRRFQLNKTSKQIGKMKGGGEDPGLLIREMKNVSGEIKELEGTYKKMDEELKSILLEIPNIPDESVPVGTDSSSNQEVRRFGKKPVFPFDPKPHWEIGKNLGILDFDRAAKLAGSRFAVYMGLGAKLERALINFMLDLHTREKGYKEVLPPFIANEESLIGTGNLPKFEEDLFKLRGQPWYLIPTAEVPLTNLYREEILDGESLPLRYVAYTPCFRSEAGSYGKDIRGLIRQHQFNKVELASFALPEQSFQELDRLTKDAEDVLKKLGIPFRSVLLCTGEMGFAGVKTYDLELWMPHRNKYLEISSCTNCADFQARRANIRFRRSPKSKPEFVHTLNGSGVAIGRTVSAILECFQQEDGSVLIPEALQPYMDGLERMT